MTSEVVLPPTLALRTIPSSILIKQDVLSLYIDHHKLNSVPEELCSSLKSLQKLSLIGNDIEELPENLNCLTDLRELYLTENSLTSLPDSVCEIDTLQILKLTGNGLLMLPDDFGCLCSLKELYVDENCLGQLPETFGLLDKLEVLELNDNKLKSLPENFGHLKNLQILNLSSNKLKELPESFTLLESVRELDISGNQLESLPSKWIHSSKLRKFYADNNHLGTLPNWFKCLTELEDLSLKDNQFYCSFPDEFGYNSKKLKRCDLAGNFMSSLCETFGELQNLEYLDLGSVIDELERRNFQNGNWLTHLPKNFGALQNLREAHLDENKLTDLPESFGDLRSLEYLDLGQNLLQQLPSSFGNLCSLNYCQLSKNKLQSLPESFGNLHHLKELRLDNNEITELPESFFKLHQLQILDLFNNNLSVIPSGLQELTNLKKLDIDENNFGLPVLEVPQILLKAKYPERKAELKSNWRGRPRVDLVNVEKTQHTDDQEDMDSVINEDNESENFLLKALEKGSSLWNRKHGSTDKREKASTETDRTESIEQSQMNDIPENLNDSSSLCDESKFLSSTEVAKDIRSMEPEDWDKELEELGILNNPYDDPPIYKHPVTDTFNMHKHIAADEFCPSDMHAQPVHKFHTGIFYCQEGQFDDVEDDDFT